MFCSLLSIKNYVFVYNRGGVHCGSFLWCYLLQFWRFFSLSKTVQQFCCPAFFPKLLIFWYLCQFLMRCGCIFDEMWLFELKSVALSGPMWQRAVCLRSEGVCGRIRVVRLVKPIYVLFLSFFFFNLVCLSYSFLIPVESGSGIFYLKRMY